MKKLQFKINITAPVSLVFDRMLGLSQKSSYEAWTSAFNPTSTYEGNWAQGSKMFFVGVDENGEKGGMVSEIKANTPHQFVSIRHYGMLQGNVEITEGEDVEKWAGGLENYSFEETNGVTTVTVDLDTAEDFEEYMNETYPAALQKLKELCE